MWIFLCDSWWGEPHEFLKALLMVEPSHHFISFFIYNLFINRYCWSSYNHRAITKQSMIWSKSGQVCEIEFFPLFILSCFNHVIPNWASIIRTTLKGPLPMTHRHGHSSFPPWNTCFEVNPHKNPLRHKNPLW